MSVVLFRSRGAGLCNISMKYVILMLFCILIITPITTHYFLSSLAGGYKGDEVELGQLGGGLGELGVQYGNRFRLDHTEDLTSSRIEDLKVSMNITGFNITTDNNISSKL